MIGMIKKERSVNRYFYPCIILHRIHQIHMKSAIGIRMQISVRAGHVLDGVLGDGDGGRKMN